MSNPKTADREFEAVNYHRFADDSVISVSGHHTKRGWAERALQRLREQIAPLGVELNLETWVKTVAERPAFCRLNWKRSYSENSRGHGIGPPQCIPRNCHPKTKRPSPV